MELQLAAAGERERGGRRLVTTSAKSGQATEQANEQMTERLAGLEETRAGGRLAEILKPRLADAEEEVLGLREEYLAARVERRQAETLIQEAEAEATEADRRSQQGLDDWFGNRLHRIGQQKAAEQKAEQQKAAQQKAAQQKELRQKPD